MVIVMPAKGIPIFFFALFFMMVGAFTAAIFVEKQTPIEWAMIVSSYIGTYLIFTFLHKRQKSGKPLLGVSIVTWITSAILGSCLGIIMVFFA